MDRDFLEEKITLHVDMDAFFVSVEERLNPALKGKSVVVGGDPNGRGVVSAASYKAREYGIHSAMPMAEAKRLCPRAVFLRGSMGVYSDYSNRIMEVLERFTPVVEKVSIDEAYLDLTGCQRMHNADHISIAHRIHNAIESEIGLAASIGIGSNKLIAKIATNAAKPNGLMMIRPGYEASFLASLPIEKMPGVGPVMEKEYRKMGIRVIGDLLRFSPDTLQRVFGKHGAMMAKRARGEGPTPNPSIPASGFNDREHANDGYSPEGKGLGPDAKGLGFGGSRGLSSGINDTIYGKSSGANRAKSISREITYSTDTEDPERLKATLSYLAESVGRRVRKSGLMYRGVHLKLRYSDFTTYTRSRAFAVPSDDTRLMFNTAIELLNQLFTKRSRVRLIGVGVSTTEPITQLDLFGKEERAGEAVRSMDTLRDRYGFESVMMARSYLHSSAKSGRG